jgi:hypothetical protein
VALRAVRAGELTITVPDPDAVPEEELAAALVLYASLVARAAARALGRRPLPPDRLLDGEQAADRLRTTYDWLKRQKDLPFRVELSEGQTRYSERGLEAWIAARVGGRP